jgi:hypothetical protein
MFPSPSCPLSLLHQDLPPSEKNPPQKPKQKKTLPLNSTSFPNTSIWVTEYALNNQSLATTQSFFNTSAQYLDRLSSIERYSYFGAFRSDDSNVGPNAAMLTQKGQLTDIGSWYLGGKATANIPSAAAAARWPGVWVGWGLLLGVLGLGL